jgi:hypothetical protein
VEFTAKAWQTRGGLSVVGLEDFSVEVFHYKQVMVAITVCGE